MSHKSALQQIISIGGYVHEGVVTASDALVEVVNIAREALATSTSTGEVKRYEQDLERANAAIAALERVKANPNVLMTNTDVICPYTERGGKFVGIPCIPDNFMPAVESELARMRAAVSNPEALRAIYRRNEVRQ